MTHFQFRRPQLSPDGFESKVTKFRTHVEGMCQLSAQEFDVSIKFKEERRK